MKSGTKLFLIGLVVLYLVSGFFALNELNIYAPDSGRYLLWANSLARGDGYRDTSTPEPTRYVVHSPLYAILLAPSQWLLPNSVEAAKATTLLFGSIAILLVFFLLKEIGSEKLALAGTIFFLFYPETINYSTQVLTEIPFVCATVSLFLLVKKYITVEKPSLKLTLSLVVNIAVVTLLREVGLVLAMSVVFYFFVLKRRKEAIVFFLITVSIYGGWMIRNELIVAPAENPTTQNSRIFTTHMYTETTAPMYEEYLARLSTNATIYWNIFKRSVFTGGFYFPLRREIFVTSFPIQWIDTSLSIVTVLATVVTLFLLVVGVYFAIKNQWKLNFLFLSYSVFNLSVFLIYPITDVRFLYPLFPIVLFYGVYGIQSIFAKDGKQRKPVQWGGIVVLTVLSIPNIVWSVTYQWENITYARNPLIYSTMIERGHEYFSRALKPVGEWLCEHTPSDAVVVSKWNELALFLNGRKVMLTNSRTSPMEFEPIVRDYGIRYIVCGINPDSSNEYQQLFAQSRKYLFIPVYRKGSVEIREIVPKKVFQSRGEAVQYTSTYERDYNEAYSSLETDPRKSLNDFFLMALKYKNIDCMFNMGVTYEFLDSLQRAESYFKKFLYLQQGGAYLRVVNIHLTILSYLRKAETDSMKTVKASYYHAAAMGVWSLGYPHRARILLGRAISEDSTFFPACITAAVFALQEGDTATSRRYLALARKYEPYNVLTKNLLQIHACYDTLKQFLPFNERIRLRIAIATAYRTMGFINMALDELFDVRTFAPNDIRILELLAQYLEEKKCYYSARAIYATLQSLNPQNSFYQENYSALTRAIE